jgi:hypothetical protein
MISSGAVQERPQGCLSAAITNPWRRVPITPGCGRVLGVPRISSCWPRRRVGVAHLSLTPAATSPPCRSHGHHSCPSWVIPRSMLSGELSFGLSAHTTSRILPARNSPMPSRLPDTFLPLARLHHSRSSSPPSITCPVLGAYSSQGRMHARQCRPSRLSYLPG